MSNTRYQKTTFFIFGESTGRRSGRNTESPNGGHPPNRRGWRSLRVVVANAIVALALAKRSGAAGGLRYRSVSVSGGGSS